ncbi:MAG TPA: hypothetical protein GXX26_09135 [Clostridiaceae bacterium]|jgi:hypothetical protein|nr:hypothetical protein [Clostridiaceae bacterium]
MNFQLIDEFRRRTNATYEEAKYYLERFNGDLLEAIVAYERERTRGSGVHTGANRFLYGIMRMVQKLIDIRLVITDKDFKAFPIPLLLLILLSPVWHILVLVAILMLIMGYRFSFQEIHDPNMNLENIVERIKNKARESN